MDHARATRTVLIAAVWCLCPQSSFAQAGPEKGRPAGVIDGIVTDTSLVALAEATISLFGTEIRVVTGTNGRFRILRVPAGQHIVIARRVGYEPASARVQVSATDTLRLSFALERIVSTLDTVVVAEKRRSPKMAEFGERRKYSIGGKFMTQAEIEKRNTVFATELIRTFVSVRVVSGGAASARQPIGMPPCLMTVLVDGLPFRGSLDNLPSPKLLAGIEVYAGPATIPLPYKRTERGTCGLILVWTRDGS